MCKTQKKGRVREREGERKKSEDECLINIIKKKEIKEKYERDK